MQPVLYAHWPYVVRGERHTTSCSAINATWVGHKPRSQSLGSGNRHTCYTATSTYKNGNNSSPALARCVLKGYGTGDRHVSLYARTIISPHTQHLNKNVAYQLSGRSSSEYHGHACVAASQHTHPNTTSKEYFNNSNNM